MKCVQLSIVAIVLVEPRSVHISQGKCCSASSCQLCLALRVLVLVEHEVDEERGADEGGLHADVEVLREPHGEGAHVGAHLAAALGPLLGDGPDLALAVAPGHLKHTEILKYLGCKAYRIT